MQVRERSQVRKQDQGLVERGVHVVGTPEVAQHGGVAAHHVVVGRQVGVAQRRGGRPIGAHGTAIAAELGLREYDSNFHACSVPAPVRVSGMKVRIFVEPQQGAEYQRLLAVAQEAEACGFDAFFRSDHYLTMGGDGLPGPTDPWVTLGALAREPSHIRLGTLVTSSTFRWPGILAITVAQVDGMSGGRIELGLGTGWYEGEHTAYGIPFQPLGERFARLEEQLSIITGLWDTPMGETYSFAGKHYQLANSPALPKPVQRPHPPVIVGG